MKHRRSLPRTHERPHGTPRPLRTRQQPYAPPPSTPARSTARPLTRSFARKLRKQQRAPLPLTVRFSDIFFTHFLKSQTRFLLRIYWKFTYTFIFYKEFTETLGLNFILRKYCKKDRIFESSTLTGLFDLFCSFLQYFLSMKFRPKSSVNSL